MKTKSSVVAGARCAVAVAGMFANVVIRAADYWPQFRGPNGAGIAESATPPTQFGPGKNLHWKSPAPAGVSSPIVWGDHLFLTGVIEKELVTLAYDTRTGRERWRRSVAPEKLETVHKFSSAAASTPCTDKPLPLKIRFPISNLPGSSGVRVRIPSE